MSDEHSAAVAGISLPAGGPPDAERGRRALAALGARLRHLREDAGLSGRELARRTGWSPSKVSRLETGAYPPSAADVRTWCEHTDAPGQADELVASLRELDSLFIEWRQLGVPGLAAIQRCALSLWERTRTRRAYFSYVVPVPLQTTDYMRALLQAVRDRNAMIDDVEAAIQVRSAKQDALHDSSRRFVVLLEESALSYRVGTPATMAGQLGHLLAVSSLPTLSLGIIPAQADRSAVRPAEQFVIYDDALVRLELLTGSLQLTQRHEITQYAEAFRSLTSLAVYGAQARGLISRAIAAVDT